MADNYPGRNSAKDVQQRVAQVEESRIPAVQEDVDALLEQMNDEVLDAPDFTLLFQSALT